MRKHIQILCEAESKSKCTGKYEGLMWGRVNDSTIWISTLGYKHMDHGELEKDLLKAGCRYDFSRKVQDFDRCNGRTTTYFKEPTRLK